MLLHPTAVALLLYLSKSKRWEPLGWLNANPRLPRGAVEIVPSLVAAGLLIANETTDTVRISISGLAVVKLLSLRDRPFARLMFAAAYAFEGASIQRLGPEG